jgi:hypothetical protein
MEKKEKAIVYKLFAMLTNEANVRIATEYRFQRITPAYILVYGEEAPKRTKYTEITAKDLSSLSKKDFQWLQDANIALIREVADTHKESQSAELKKFWDELLSNIKDELKENDGERENNESGDE